MAKEISFHVGRGFSPGVAAEAATHMSRILNRIIFGVRQLAAAFVSQYQMAAKAQASLRTPKKSAIFDAAMQMDAEAI